MSARMFSELMEGLLKELKIPLPDNLHQEVCTLHFEGQPDIHFINHVPQYVDIITDAGVLPSPPTADKLLDLFALNNLDNKALPASITVHRTTGTIIVMCRQHLAQLDVPALLQMKQSIHAKVAAVQSIVDKSTARVETKNAATLVRMTRLMQNPSINID